ncbi:MAG: UDP-glucose 4-epimerase GalE [Bacilli bacterium]|nr:UDP-glucose 4-epimerase GalE [Bacilli bacterium]
MKILVTGGLGFIGSETVISLIENGYEVVIVDNLANSKIGVLDRIETITGVRPDFVKVDCCDKEALNQVFDAYPVSGVIHFAGLKAVGESVRIPLAYYRNNLLSTINLVEAMAAHNVYNLVFSSSATVYGDPKELPLLETTPLGETTNPYGETKKMIERILTDFNKANPQFNIALLRYFNPIGGHKSGLLGEDPTGIPNNLLPYVTQVAIGRRDKLHVYGNDYPTEDGTCIRDYIHVCDLAEGHVATIKYLEEKPGLVIFNLGTGKGTSVFGVLKAFEEATGVKIPYQIDPRRPGDVTANYANVDKAEKILHWKAKRDVKQACFDAYQFQVKNPKGIE